MAERATIARPYAEAVFMLAAENDSMQRWSDVLAFYATAMQDKQLKHALGNPRLKPEQKASLLNSLLKGISEQESSLLSILLDNGKLQLMPEISTLFEARRADAEGTIQAQVISAFELDEAQVASLAAAMKDELNRDVTIATSVDPSIIGGVIIRAGDTVIDGSVAGSLKDLTSYLTR